MSNQFTEIYKKLPTSKLLDIIENKNDYQSIAIEAAKLELESREDIEAAKNELQEKKSREQIKTEAESQKRAERKEKTLKVVYLADPWAKKTPEKTVVVICIIMTLIFLYKMIFNFGMIRSLFSNLADGDVTVILQIIDVLFLPVSIFFLWRKSMIGWTLFVIWLGYQILSDCLGIYAWYRLSNIYYSNMDFMPMPSLSNYLIALAVHGSLIYFICKPNTKSIFEKKKNVEALDADL